MEKLLTQAEIDALFHAARGAGAAGDRSGPARVIEPWDLHQASLLGEEQLRSITQVHENFARNLSATLGNVMRDQFDVTLSAVEQLTCRDFMARFSDVSYCGIFRIPPSDAKGIVQMDVNLAFSIVDLLLGGPGQSATDVREVTEIEEQLLEGISRTVCAELHSVWQDMGLQFEFEGRQPASQMMRIVPMQETTLTSAFEITMAHCKGMLNLAFPSAVSSELMRKMRAEGVHPGPRGSAVNQERISRQLLKSVLGMEVASRPLPTRLSDLLELRPGAVLKLRCAIDEPMMLRAGGRDCWSSRVVNTRERRGAQLLKLVVHEEGR